jgi:hypothetical protein
MQKPDSGKFVIACDPRSVARTTLDAAINAKGEALRVLDNVWILRAEGSAGTIRNDLIQILGARDTLFVADLMTARTAVHHLGPEMETRIRRVTFPDLSRMPRHSPHAARH